MQTSAKSGENRVKRKQQNCPEAKQKIGKTEKMQNSQKQQNWQKMQNCAEAKQQICKTEKMQNYQNRGSISDKKPQTQAAGH